VSDARWLEVDDDIRSAVKHLGNAVAIFDRGISSDDELSSYVGRMAFLQAMQAGYTSLEGAFERILEILGEEKPTTGFDYHAQIIRRIGRAIEGERPAILAGELLRAVDEARRFRHVARKSYDDFEISKAGPAVAAAKRISTGIEHVIAAFRKTLAGDGAEANDKADLGKF